MHSVTEHTELKMEGVPR